MHVETPPDILDTAARLGAGVPYALKVLAGQLADDPEMGRPSALPGILSATVDGAMLEDCPDLTIGYIREPDRIQIRYAHAVPTAGPAPEAQAGDRRESHPASDAVTAGEISDARHRITRWLQHNAPPLRSCAPCRRGRTRRRCPGAGPRSGDTRRLACPVVPDRR
ncbi:hypothetical protein GCM10023323_16400 [Streptomyces thinghirensis]|uniref:Uncharacterized protein n=1 Tax=Streptomyces thinghirensis TaxID=551547 RepID=A0ABP9SXX1_9ACTN